MVNIYIYIIGMGEKEIEEEGEGGKKMNASVLSQDKSSLELNRKLI